MNKQLGVLDIGKVNIKKGVVTTSHKETSQVEDRNVIDRADYKHGRPPHPDLMKRMNAFRIHWAILCDYVSKDFVSPDHFDQDNEDSPHYIEAKLKDISIRTIHLKGDADARRIQIVGLRKTQTDKVITITTPQTNVIEKDAYPFQHALEIDINLFLDEVTQFLRGEKYGDFTLFDEQEDEDEDDFEAEEDFDGVQNHEEAEDEGIIPEFEFEEEVPEEGGKQIHMQHEEEEEQFAKAK